jgi:carboxymethylenebutenolidase
MPASTGSSSFAVTSLTTGFAVASNPVLAQAITTDTKDLAAGEVKIKVADGEIPGYVARPAKAGKFPVILVVQEIFGVREHIKDMCRRFAKMGYYAIAPEMFARQGDVSKMTDIMGILTNVVSKMSDAQVNADLDAAVAFAKPSGHANADRIGLVGYCWACIPALIPSSNRKSLPKCAAKSPNQAAAQKS